MITSFYYTLLLHTCVSDYPKFLTPTYSLHIHVPKVRMQMQQLREQQAAAQAARFAMPGMFMGGMPGMLAGAARAAPGNE